LCPGISYFAPALPEGFVGKWVLVEADEGGKVYKPDETDAETIQFSKDSAEIFRAERLHKVQIQISKLKDLWHVDFVFGPGVREPRDHAYEG
jgi:hypothetical protein